MFEFIIELSAGDRQTDDGNARHDLRRIEPVPPAHGFFPDGFEIAVDRPHRVFRLLETRQLGMVPVTDVRPQSTSRASNPRASRPSDRPDPDTSDVSTTIASLYRN